MAENKEKKPNELPKEDSLKDIPIDATDMEGKGNTSLPEQPSIAMDQSKLTPTQQKVVGYLSGAKQDPPRITDVRDLFVKIEMEVPAIVRRGPEFDYAWLAVDDLDGPLSGKWELVNRSNHSHVPSRMFDASGGILYKGQNILAFCYREARELEQAAIVKHYNDKTAKIEKIQETAVEGQVTRVDPDKAGTVFNAGLIDDITEQMGYQPDKNDF